MQISLNFFVSFLVYRNILTHEYYPFEYFPWTALRQASVYLLINTIKLSDQFKGGDSVAEWLVPDLNCGSQVQILF